MRSNRGNRRNLSTLDQIAEYLAERPHGVLCTEIARRFLRMNDPRAAEASEVVGALLGRDERFVALGTGLWTAHPEGLSSLPRGQEAAGEREITLFGAARRSANGRTASIGLIRVEGDRAEELSYEQLLADPQCASSHAVTLSTGAQIVLFSAAGSFRFSAGSSPFRLRWWAESIFPGRSFRAVPDLAAFLNHTYVDDDSSIGEARLVREIYERLRESHGAPLAGDDGAGLPEEIPFLREGGEELIGELPELPGVYRMRDRNGALLYVGKSRSLRSRLESWFHGYRQLPESKRKMIRAVARVDVDRVGSDLEALIVEEGAIRREEPRWNEQREVHTGHSPAAPMVDRIIFLPAVDHRYVTLFLVSSDGAIGRYLIRRSTRKSAALGNKLRRFFVDRRGSLSPQAHVVAERWLRANRNRVTALDCSRYASMEEVIAVVLSCLKEPGITDGQRFEILPPSAGEEPSSR